MEGWLRLQPLADGRNTLDGEEFVQDYEQVQIKFTDWTRHLRPHLPVNDSRNDSLRPTLGHSCAMTTRPQHEISVDLWPSGALADRRGPVLHPRIS